MNSKFRKIIAYVLVFTMAMTMNVNVFAAADVVTQTEPTATVEDVQDHEHSEDGECLVEEESTTDETAAGEEEQDTEAAGAGTENDLATEADEQATESDDESDESGSDSAKNDVKGTTPPVTVKTQTAASTVHSHPVCGTSCKCASSSHTDLTWTAWDGTTKMYNGNYYLTEDVVLSSTMILDYSYTSRLCLNGYSITCEDTVFDIYSYRTLIITDCKGNGKVETTGYGPTIANNKQLNIWGGTILNSGDNAWEAITAYSNTATYVYGGNIESADSDGIYDYGGSKIVVKGGTVQGANSAIGGQGTDAAQSSITISGGTFITESGYMALDIQDGDFTMTGGLVKGRVYISDETGNTVISGGTIEGGLICDSNTLSITGGSCYEGLTSTAGQTMISGGKFDGLCYLYQGEDGATATISGGDFSSVAMIYAYGKTWISGGYYDQIELFEKDLYLSGVPEIKKLYVKNPNLVSAQNPDGTGSYGGDPVEIELANLSTGEDWKDGDIIVKNVKSDDIAKKFVLRAEDSEWHYTEKIDNDLILKEIPHGQWKSNVTWSVDAGVLTIKGDGEIAEAYNAQSFPWYKYHDEITKIVVEPGITRICPSCFAYCGKVETIILPETVADINLHAFDECASLKNLMIPSSVNVITGSSSTGNPTFVGCGSLTDLYYFGTVEDWNEIVNAKYVESADSSMTIHFLEKVESTATCTEAGTQAYYQFDDTSVYKDMYDTDRNVITELETVPALGHSYGEWVVDQEPAYGVDGSRHATCSVCGDVNTETLTVGTVDSGKCGTSLNWTMYEDGTLEIAGTGAMYDYGEESYKTTAPWAEYYNDNLDIVIKRVVLSDGVTHIGDYAFYRMYWVGTELSIPEACKTIGDYAFYNGGFTGELVLPSEIESIGDYAFGSNSSLKGDLLLPDSLTALGSNAFNGCSKLTGELTLPDSITEIPNHTFCNCSFTGELVIPESVTAIGDSAFYSCDFTGELVIPENVSSIGVGAFSACKGFTGFPQLPEGLEVINESAFKACSGLTGPFEIPESVTAIGKDAFNSCTNLAGEISLSENVQEIGPGAFWNTKAAKIKIPNANCAFDNTSSYAISSNAIIYGYAGSTADVHAAKYNKPFIAIDVEEEEGVLVSGTCGDNLSWALGEDGVLTISGTGAMYDYNNNSAPWSRYKTLMNSLVLEEGITYIGTCAFTSCSTLKGELIIPESVTDIGDCAFELCSGFTGDLIIPEGVTYVGNMAFVSCYNLDGELTLPEGLIIIGADAFSDCSQLTGELRIPDSVESIGTYAFAFSNNLTGFVEIPDNVTAVNVGIFRNVKKLEGIILHENVESVGAEAFSGCGTANNPCSIVVFNDQLTFTDINVMDGSGANLVVYGHEGSAIQQQIAGCQYIKFVAFDEETCTHPEDCRVKIAGSDATCQNTGMSEGEKCGLCNYITVEQTAIPAAAHTWDTNYTVDTEPACTEMGIQSIHCSICDVIKEGSHAPIPALGHSYNEWTIEKPVKFGEAGIERQYCQNDCGEYNERELTIVDSGICGETVTWTVDVEGVLIISGTGAMSDYKVTTDRPWHSYSSKIKKVQIEEGVTTIGDYAFMYLTNLTAVALPSTLTAIGESAFYECRALEGELDIPDSVTVIERNAFNVCESLTGVKLPSGLKQIEDFTFQYCHGLTGTLTIPEGVTYIGNLAFQNCTNIKAIELPDSLTGIYNTAFMGCTGITGKIVVPRGMTALSNQFSDTSITSIVLPFAVKSFGVNALSGIGSLKAVYIYNPECDIPDTTFANKDIVIYGMTDSTAQTFAESKGYTFQVISEDEAILAALDYKLDDEGNAVITSCHTAFKGIMVIPAEIDGHKVVAIGDRAFADCSKITEIVLPETVAEIGKEAFESCDSLQNITILNNECIIFDREDTIPVAATITGYKDSTAKAYADKYGNDFVYYECLTGEHVYGAWKVTKIATATEEGSARRDCAGCDAYEVQALALDANVLGAGSCGYNLNWILTADGQLRIYGTGSMNSYSSNNNQMTTAPWGAYASKLKTVVIEDGVTSIGDYAFYNCDMLTGNLNLPKTLTSIGYYAFSGCDGFNGSLAIPDSVTYIGYEAFENCSGFDGELILSKNLSEIYGYAFRGCSGFTGDLVIPDSVNIIRYGVFSGCSGFDGNLILPANLKSIENDAFENCSGFTGKLNLPETLNNLENYAFRGCSGFTGDLIIPESITALSDYVFYECSGFDGKLVLHDGIAKLGNHVFAYCSGLTGELVLPENLVSIGDQAFYDCSGLTGAVIVPSTVTSIGYSAFGQTNFKDIYIPDSVVEYGHYGPGGYLEEVTYHIYPGSAVDQYFATTAEQEKVVYMVDEVYVPKQEDYLAFKSSSIAVTTAVDGIVNIMDLLVSSKELTVEDLEVEFSSESVAMYFEGEIAGISAGECKITVTAGELTATAMLKVTESVTEPEYIMFTNANVTIEKGLSAYVQPVILPFTASAQSLTWSSSNSSIVKVDSVGRITAVGAGTATITVRHSSGQTASYQVTSEVPIQDIIITEPVLPLEMHKGDITKLDYYLYPFNSTDALKTQFINDNTDVVTIDSKGKITAVGSGTANITIKNGDIEKTIQVIVTNPLKGVSIANAPANAYNGDKFKLNLVLDPVDADNAGTPVWSSSNESIATVDQDGNVTIKGVGYVYITVEVNEFKAQCRIICPAVPVTKIVLSETSVDLACGETAVITAEKLPVNTTDTKAFTWTSSDEKVAVVDENGKVTAVTEGTAVITAAIGKVTARCIVNIKHEWGSEYSVDKAATCTEDGVESIHCISCDAPDPATERVIPATGHTEAVREGVDATCTTDQMLGGTYCSTCGEIFSGHETVPGTALGHKYDEGTVTEPTCKEGGFTTYKCIRCDDSYVADETDAVDHKYEEYVSNNDATCTTDGTETAECIFGCGNKNTQTDKGSALGHDVKKWRITVFATSSQQGTRQGTCQRCSNVITETIPADPQVLDANYCGDDLIWTLKHDGTMVISGEGRMYDHYSGWDEYKETEVKSLVFEDGITYIGAYAFDDFEALTGTLTIPNTVTEIGYDAFADCTGLTGSLIIPDSVNAIRSYAFDNCHNFDGRLVLSKNLKTIENSAFRYCYGFTGELVLPDSLESIGAYAFESCSGFTGNLIIPEKITNIRENTFYCCYGIKGNIIIPDTVTTIESYGISDVSPKYMYIPDSVRNFGNYAIHGYDTLYYIYPNSAAEEYLIEKGYEDRIVYITDSIEPGEQIEYLDFKAQTIVTDVDTTVNVLDYLVCGEAITKDDITVTLSNEEIAVYGDGQIVALGAGECIVTVSAGSLSCSTVLKIKDSNTAVVRPETIVFNESELVIEKGTTIFNQPVMLPVTVNDTTVYWTSSDSSVALVDYRGQVTGIGPGTAEITAKVSDTVYATYTVKVTSPLQQIIVPDAVSEYTINKGDAKAISFYTYPFDAEDEIKFISSNEDIVTVDENGVMTATGAGKATVTIAGAGKTAAVNVTVTNVLKGISMAKESVTIGSGNSMDLELILHPADAEEVGEITWKSSNEKVATVDSNGRVTTVAVGVATITAEVDGFTASCRIVSKAIPMTGLEMETDNVNMVYGDTCTLTVNRIPENTSNKTPFTWTSSDEDVVTVDENGVITAAGVGVATVTAAVGDFKASCKVTVGKADPEISIPEGLTVLVGKTIADIELPEGFAWKDASQSVGERGAKTFNAIYTPADTANYNIIEDIQIPVKVRDPKVLSVTMNNANLVCKGGTTQLIVNIETQDDPDYRVSWMVEDPSVATVDENGLATVIGEGETKVTVVVGELSASGTIKVVDHTWDTEYTVDKPATCTETGVKSIHCIICDSIDQNTVTAMPMLPHEKVIDEAVAPTCTETGLTEGSHCSICDEVLAAQEIIPATGHEIVTYEGNYITCEEPGWYPYEKCNKCDYTTYEEIPVTGHDYDNTDYREATCIEAEYWLYECYICNDSYVEEGQGPTGIHQREPMDRAPTCTEPGYTGGVHCPECGKIFVTPTEVPAIAHEVVVVAGKEPTCMEPGYTEEEYCKNCGTVFIPSETIDVTDHIYGDWTVVTQPAYGQVGIERQYCQYGCGEYADEREINIISSGYCGEDVSYVLTVDGTLTISGAGEMYDYAGLPDWGDAAPWYDYMNDVRALVVEEGVTSIGEMAFYCFNYIESVNLADSIESIGMGAFRYAFVDNVEIELPTELREIGDYAFYECNANISGSLPDKLQYIGDYSFSGCNGMSGYINLPESVNYIGQYAFSNCNFIERVIINNRECNIGYNAFADNIWLVGYSESTADMHQQSNGRFMTFCAHENTEHQYGELTGTEVSCTEDGDQLRFCKKCNYRDHVITPATGHDLYSPTEYIPPTCTEQGCDSYFVCRTCNKMFADSTAQTELTAIPYISPTGHIASIRVPAVNATCVTEGNIEYFKCECGKMYADAMAMEELTPEETVVSKLGHSYGEWTVVTPATFGQAGIERQYCQYGCGEYADEREITIVDSGNASKDVTWKIDIDKTLTFSGTGPITDTTSYGEYSCVYTKVVIEEGITEIPYHAFGNQPQLRSIELADSIEVIGESAFTICGGLTGDIKLPANLKYIGAWAFYETDITGQLVIPDGVTYIGEYAFGACKSLTGTLVIPAGIKTVNAHAFESCMGLEKLIIEEGIQSIGDNAFYDCNKLEGKLVIPDSVATIGNYAFHCCSNITDVALGKGIKEIGEWGLGFTENYTEKGTIVLPESLEKINANSFGAWNFDTIVVLNPDCILDHGIAVLNTVVGYEGSTAQQYVGCILASTAKFEYLCDYYGNEHTYGAGVVTTEPTVTEPGVMTFTCNECNYVKTTVLPALGPEGCDHTDVITLPAVGAGCETTGLTAGSQCVTCGTIMIAQNVIPAIGHSYGEGVVIKPPTAIENGIKEFICSNCGNKKTTEIPAEGTVVASGYCGKEAKWVINTDKKMIISGTGAIEFNTQFAQYSSYFDKVIIEEGITEIYPQMFQNNTNVKEIVLPDSMEKIGAAAFAYAENLVMNPDLPDRLKVIEDHAFNGITFKKGELKLPQGLNSIGVGAFAYCTGLEGTLTIPGSCLNIGQSAFLGCTNINNLIVEGSISTLFEGTFDNCFGGQLDTVVLPFSLMNCDNAFGMITIDTLVVKSKDTILSFDGTAFTGKIVGYENSAAKDLYNKVNGRPTPIVFQTLCDYYGWSHKWNEEMPLEWPTCTSPGKSGQMCTECGTHRYLTIPALGHDLVQEVEYEPPTCTTPGKVGYYTCRNCLAMFEDAEGKKHIAEPGVIPPTGHKYGQGDVMIPPTATEYGIMAYFCLNCEHYYEENIPPTGGGDVACKHQSMTLIQGYEATCTEPGATSGVQCADCGTMLIEPAIIDPLGHDLGQWSIDQEATCTEDGYRRRSCSRCDAEPYEIIPATGHDYGTFTKVVTRATTKAAGKIGTYQYCMNCENEDSAELISTTQIKKIAPVKMSATAMAYTGKSRIPTLTVKDSSGKKLKKGTDYKVTIKNSAGKVVTAPKVVGKYKITITFQGNYKGTVTKYYNINPKATTLGKLTSPGKKQIKATWTKRTVQVTGYEIQYSTTKNFKKGTNKTVKVTKYNTKSKTFKTTKSKKLYYVKIRTYKTVKGVKFYSAWSKAKTIKTK